MMPLIVKDFKWHQTPDSISIVVKIPKVVAAKTDILTSHNYARVHCHPYIFEVFLWGHIDDQKGTCTIDAEKGSVSLTFPKLPGPPKVEQEVTEPSENEQEDASTPPPSQPEVASASGPSPCPSWPSLESQGLNRIQKKEIRDAAVNASHQRHQKETEAAMKRRDQLRKHGVMELIRMDDENRAKIAQVKRAEAERALCDIQRWTQGEEMESGETSSRVVEERREYPRDKQVTGKSGGLALDERMMKGRTKRNPEKGKEPLEYLMQRGPQQLSILPPKDTPKHKGSYRQFDHKMGIHEAHHYLTQGAGDASNPLSASTSSSTIWPEFGTKAEEKGSGIRQAQTITVKFTPREFVTPARESTQAMEEEWLKKQVEARRLSGFNEPDLTPEERNPDWLLQKGKSLMKAGSGLGAVSAFSLGIKLAPKLPDLYLERGKAHLEIGNFMKVVDDCSYAIELFTPKVPSNAPERLICHMTRAKAFQSIKMYPECLKDLREASAINPTDEALKKQITEVEALKSSKESDSDSD